MSQQIVEYFNTIETSFKRMKFLTVIAIVAMVAVCLGAVAFTYSFLREQGRQVYVIDQGQPLLAMKEDAGQTLESRAYQHVRIFHMYFFNLMPNKEALDYNIEQALLLADRSAYNYWATLNEHDYYSRLVSENISQQMSVDSIKVNTKVYPYEAACYGKLYSVRESSMTAYDIVTTCTLIGVPFTPEHPTGLLMERFKVVRREEISTRSR